MADQNQESQLMKAFNRIQFFINVLGFMLPQTVRLLRLQLTAIYHNRTYKPVEVPRNIIIIGGSFGGIHLTKWLADAVPTGYRVVLIEQNSHFNYLFAFPRYTAIAGHEQDAFVPYEEILSGPIKKGSVLHVHAKVAEVTANQVLLTNKEAIDYAYLVIATGSTQLPPAKMRSVMCDDACEEMRDIQQRISAATRVAVLGCGAVGVESAADIKTYFPDKDVTIFSSRDVVMPNFGSKLQARVASILKEVGVRVRYNTRPKMLPSGNMIQHADGTTEEFDVVVSHQRISSIFQKLSMLLRSYLAPVNVQIPKSLNHFSRKSFQRKLVEFSLNHRYKFKARI